MSLMSAGAAASAAEKVHAYKDDKENDEDPVFPDPFHFMPPCL